MVSFNQVPANANVPLLYAEISSSRATTPSDRFRTLLIGQRLSSGTIAVNQPRQISGLAEAQVAFGANSQLSYMADKFRENSPVGEMWAVALADPAGTAATADITVTAAPSAAGIIALYIDGRRIQIPVAGGETVNKTADLIHEAVTARASELAVTSAEPAAAKVTLTHRHVGAVDLDVRWNYQPDDIFPTTFAATIAVTAGAGAPTKANLEAAINAAGDEEFGLIVHPFADAASLKTIEDVLVNRWGPLAQIGGIAITSYRSAAGTQDEATVFGNARNSPFSCVIGHGRMPTPTHEMAAAVAGAIHTPIENDPAQPLQTLEVIGVVPPSVADRWDYLDRDTVLGDGIATYVVGAGGIVRIERLVSTYQRNAANLPDEAYKDINTPLTLQWIRNDYRRYFWGKYSRFKLADDGGDYEEGQPVMTPLLARAETIERARYWERKAYVEDIDTFKKALIVQRNERNRNRLDVLLPPDLVNQLRIVGVNIAFLL